MEQNKFNKKCDLLIFFFWTETLVHTLIDHTISKKIDEQMNISKHIYYQLGYKSHISFNTVHINDQIYKEHFKNTGKHFYLFSCMSFI